MKRKSLSKKESTQSHKCQHHDVYVEEEAVLKILKENGYRVTKQRHSLVKAVIEMQRPFSAEDIMLTMTDDSVDLATIYRFLQLCNTMAFVQSVDFLDGAVRYEYLPSQHQQHHHHHIMCTDCKKVEPVDMCLVQGQERQIKKMGYVNITHKLMFFGQCSNCSA